MKTACGISRKMRTSARKRCRNISVKSMQKKPTCLNGRKRRKRACTASGISERHAQGFRAQTARGSTQEKSEDTEREMRSAAEAEAFRNKQQAELLEHRELRKIAESSRKRPRKSMPAKGWRKNRRMKRRASIVRRSPPRSARPSR